MSLTGVSLSRPSGSSWPKPRKGLTWVAGTALYVALALYVSPWIAGYTDRQQECRLRGITAIFTVAGQPVTSGGTTHWFLRCNHFQADRSQLFSPSAGILTPAEMRQRFTIAPNNL